MVSASDCGVKGPRFESPLRHPKIFFLSLSRKKIFYRRVRGEIPWLTIRPWLRQANPLESLQVSYWGRITTARSFPERSGVCEQS